MTTIVMDQVGKPIFEADITAFESRHHVKLPADYKSFLMKTNGGMPFPQAYETLSGNDVCLMQLHSLDDDYPYDLDHVCISMDLENAYSKGYLKIGRDPGGSSIFLSTRGSDYGAIYFFDREELLRESDDLVFLAKSFEDFMSSLLPL